MRSGQGQAVLLCSLGMTWACQKNLSVWSLKGTRKAAFRNEVGIERLTG